MTILKALADVDPAQLKYLQKVIENQVEAEDPQAPSADDAIWGPEPSRLELMANSLWQQAEFAARRSAALRDSLAVGTALRVVSLDAPQLLRLVREGRLITIRDDNKSFLPMWQFDADGNPLAGVPELISTFPGGPVSLSNWALAPHPEFGGLSPADLLAKGEVDVVLAAAAPSASQW